VKYGDSQPTSPFAALKIIGCPKSEAGLGLRVAQDQGSVVVTEVVDGSPAARAGLIAKDIISQVNGEPTNGLSLQQVVENLRGPQNTQVAITINRSGQNYPIEFTLTREIIKMKSAEGTQK
jgi:carboxyl-terminal processing protease